MGIMLAECNPDGTLKGAAKSLTPDVDLSFDEIVWAGNEMIITTAEQQGAKPVYGISLKQPNTASRAQCVGYSMNLSISADGTTLALNNSRLTHPAEVFVAKIGDSILKTKVPGMNVSHATMNC